ncbi:MAG: ABC transporter substrate-binding protein [Candidatus Tectomicrobia bacterium]|nr:ABC transporter substrate-binding protein [Candidatus Tectomicrobia bacterium]
MEQKEKEEHGLRGGVSRRGFLKAAGAAAGLTLGFPAVVRAQPRPIPIGIIHPVSGPLAEIGQVERLGAQLAVDEINAGGGIKSLGGAKLALMLGDSESKPAVGRAEAERLIREGAVILMGAFQSAVTLAIAQVAEQRGIPFVIDIAAADPITQRGYQHVFRIFPTVDRLATNGVNFMREVFEASGRMPKTIVAMHTNDLFGSLQAKAFVKKSQDLNAPWKITEVIPYPLTTVDLSTEVSKVKALKPEVLAPITRLRDAILMVRELYKQRVELLGVVSPGAPGLYEAEFITQLGKLAEYAMDAVPWHNPLDPRTKRVSDAFYQRYGRHLDTNSGYAYEGIIVSADALERAAGTKPEAIVAALRTTNLEARIMAGGPIKFAPNGDNVNAASAMVQVLQGRARTIWPKAIAEVPFRFPAPQLWERG